MKESEGNGNDATRFHCIHLRIKPAIIMPKILGATMQYLVSVAARCLGFVHLRFSLPPTYPDDRDGYKSGVLHPGLNEHIYQTM
jgi:hypothetical protein